MAELLRSYPENMGKRTSYALMKSTNVNKLSSIAGSVITPEAWALFEDTDLKTGELRKVLTIKADGELFGTVSKTFIDAFEDIVNFFGGDCGQIHVVGGTTKAGREFITCCIVD